MDMTETMGTVWLGLTLNCCRCHDHKYDPLNNTDYYALTAFFNQTPVTGAGRDPQTPPVLTVYSAEQQEQLLRIDESLAGVRRQLDERVKALGADQAAWEEQRLAALESERWQPLAPIEATAAKATLELLPDRSILAQGEKPDNDTYRVTLDVRPGPIAALRLEALKHGSLKGGSLSHAESGNFVLTRFAAELQPGDSEQVANETQQALDFTTAMATFEQTGHDVSKAIDGNDKTGWAVYEGKLVDRVHAAVFFLAEPVDVPEGARLIVELRHDSKHARHNLGRFRISVTSDPEAAPVVGDGDLLLALQTPPDVRTTEQVEKVRQAHQADDAEYQRLAKERDQLQKQRSGIEKAASKVMVMQDQSEPRKTFLLERGLYNEPREEVSAAVPASLTSLPEGVPSNRLGLARWLVSPDNPLTARVTVNRFWQQFFGVGLVKTPEDFGAQGEFPEHAALLDWLADDFRSHGWDVKRLVRQVVTSKTYRQSSRVTADLYERDPENRLLARGARFRMPSWMLRDQALAASGLLVPKLGGPPVNGYQPAGVWEEATFGKKKYTQDHGEALYRRSLYTFWRRIIAPTMFFDAASRQVCTVKQVRTNTPLHALLTLNDVTFVEAARILAERVLTSTADNDAARLEQVYLRVLCRPSSETERAVLLAGLERSRREYANDPAAADQLLAIGESPRDDSIDAIEHAAWTALCLAVFNLDEAVTKE